MTSEHNAHTTPSNSNNQPAKKQKMELPKLMIKPQWREKPLGGLQPGDLVSMFQELGPEAIKFTLAAAYMHCLQPGYLALQERYHSLPCHAIDGVEAKVLAGRNDTRLKPKAKLCAKAINAYGEIQRAAQGARNQPLFLEAVRLRAAFSNYLIGLQGDNEGRPETFVADIKDIFHQLIEILEEDKFMQSDTAVRATSTMPETTITAFQGASATPAITSTAIAQCHPRAPHAIPVEQSSSGNARTNTADASSDDYLQDRVANFTIDLDAEVVVEWDSIRGQDQLKSSLTMTLRALRMRADAHPTDDYSGSSFGFLLHGSQGCGKTSIAYSFAKKFGLPLYELNANVQGRYLGETSKLLTILFNHLRTVGPCVLLMDEVKGLLQRPVEGESGSKMLVQTQEHLKMLWSRAMTNQAPIFIIGTTNSPWDIEMNDFRRRFRIIEFVSLPDKSSRRDILLQTLDHCLHNVDAPELEDLVDKFAGLTAADITSMIERIRMELRSEVPDAPGFKRTIFRGLKRLIPSWDAPFDVCKSYEAFSADEKMLVLYQPIRADMIRAKLKSGEFMSVDEKTIERHLAWQAGIRSLKMWKGK